VFYRSGRERREGEKKRKRFEKLKSTDEISGSHGDEYEDDCLLGCCAV
jgi:hypothetical protein